MSQQASWYDDAAGFDPDDDEFDRLDDDDDDEDDDPDSDPDEDDLV